MPCPRCQQAVEPGAVFCGACGSPLASTARTAAAVQDHSGKAVTAFVLGALALPGSLIPVVGIMFGILGIVFGTLSVHSARRVLAISGMILASIAILVSLFFWVRTPQQLVAERTGGVATSSSSNGGARQTITTPCYSTQIPAGLKLTQTPGSCTFLATSSDKAEQVQVKILQAPQLTLAGLQTAAQADIANVVGAIPGGSVASQRSATFAGSQAYEVVIKATDGSAGTISYVYDTTSQGNLAIILHTQARASGDNYDLSSIKADWAWL